LEAKIRHEGIRRKKITITIHYDNFAPRGIKRLPWTLMLSSS
jgi:hypothetical protein